MYLLFALPLLLSVPVDPPQDGQMSDLTWMTQWEHPPESALGSSMGSPSRGRLERPVRLPATGMGFVRRARGHHYGTPKTIALIRFVASRLKEAYPESAPLLIGDISRERGGHLAPHRSHQSGRDVDIALPERSRRPAKYFKAKLSHAEIDFEKLWFILDAFIASKQLQFVFLDASLIPPLRAEALRDGWPDAELVRLLGDDRRRKGIIRHSPGHGTHMHLRFRCPQGDSACVP